MNKTRKSVVLMVVWALIVPAFVLIQMFFGDFSAHADDTVLTDEQQAEADKAAAEKEAEEEKLKDKQESLKDDLKDALKDKAKLEANLNQIQQSVTVTQKEINKTQNLIQEAENNIARKESEIKEMEEKISFQNEYLRGIIQELYYTKKSAGVNIVLASGSFADILSSSDHLITLEERVRSMAQEISDSKEQIAEEKTQLADTVDDHQELLDIKAQQKKALIADKNEVASDVAEKEATIEELQSKLAELQSDLNVLTGKSYDAKDINEAISFASKKTGVPKGILFAFLTQESGRGKNTGQCTYDDMEQKATAAYKKYGKAHGWNYKPSISNLTYRKGLFEDLVDALDYSKNKKVSCAIIPANFANYEPNQGGAMGVAQFMSDTWMGASLQSQLKSYTGHAVPDPWSLTDGTMALAIKVRNAGGTSTSSSAIKKMVTTYYGASPDKSSVAKRYYNNVLYYVKNYDKLVSN